MARMTGTEWSPANDGNSRMRMSRHDIVCIHTIVGYAPAPAAHFSTNAAGKIWQHRDTDYQSAANYQGNPRVIAIENEDFGPSYRPWSGQPPRFTAEQAEAIARILVWANKTHGIPLVPCPDSRPGSRGIAYHRQGIDGNFGSYAYGGRVPGGEVWSTSFGKTCPGDARIYQLLNEIIPRAQALANGEEEDLTPQENAALNQAWRAVTQFGTGDVFADKFVRAVADAILDTPVNRTGPHQGPTDPKTITLRDVIAYWANNTDAVRDDVAAVKKVVVS